MTEYFMHIVYDGHDYYGSYRLSNGRLVIEIPYMGSESVNVGLINDLGDPILARIAEIVMKAMVRKRVSFESGCQEMTDEVKRLRLPFSRSPFSLLDAADLNDYLHGNGGAPST